MLPLQRGDENDYLIKAKPRENSFDARSKWLVRRRALLCVSDKPGNAAAPSQTSWVTLNCVMFIDESAQCCWDRGGTLSRAGRWNASIEENTDGQPRSAARRPVPGHGMPIKRAPKRKWSNGREGKGRRVSQMMSYWFGGTWQFWFPGFVQQLFRISAFNGGYTAPASVCVKGIAVSQCLRKKKNTKEK